VNLSQIPGYDRALRRAGALEDSWREFPFLGITDSICGIDVNLLTLRMFIQLCNVRSPFLVGGPIGPGDIAVFLWRLSPQYDGAQRTAPPTRAKGRARHSVRAAFVASIIDLSYGQTRRAINRFLDRMLIDKPAVTDGPSSPTDVSFAASFIHQVASAYGWSEDTILDLPMPALFQYVREIQRDKAAAAGKSRPKFNPLRSRLTRKALAKALATNSASGSEIKTKRKRKRKISK